jgi:hypothetical protein
MELHIDAKMKIMDLPEFTGKDDKIIDWFFRVNGLAEQSATIATQLGRMLPLRFKEQAFNWLQTLPAVDNNLIVQNWQTLKNAIMVHLMNATWCAKERSNAFCMRFCDSKNHDESPVKYMICKKMHLTLLQPMAFNQLIHKMVVIGAPLGWVTIV